MNDKIAKLVAGLNATPKEVFGYALNDVVAEVTVRSGFETSKIAFIGFASFLGPKPNDALELFKMVSANLADDNSAVSKKIRELSRAEKSREQKKAIVEYFLSGMMDHLNDASVIENDREPGNYSYEAKPLIGVRDRPKGIDYIQIYRETEGSRRDTFCKIEFARTESPYETAAQANALKIKGLMPSLLHAVSVFEKLYLDKLGPMPPNGKGPIPPASGDKPAP